MHESCRYVSLKKGVAVCKSILGAPKKYDWTALTVRVFPVDVQEEITVLGRIGEGAFGEVSLASSPIFGQVAIKWLKLGKVRSSC